MLHDSETEKEILLGNKQLLGIFLVVVVLLAVAFGAGYKIGQSARRNVPAGPVQTAASEPATSPSAGGETHSVLPDGTTPETASETPGTTDTSPSGTEEPAPLGSRTPTRPVNDRPNIDTEAAGPPVPAKQSRPAAPKPNASGFMPQPGEVFLQVAAVAPDEAEAIAEVLRKKGFPAHAVPKPGETKVYRVLVGPISDAGDLNSKRASLRNTGFRSIFVQRY